MSLIYEASIQFSLPPPVVPMGKVALHFLSKVSCMVWLGAVRQPPLSALATIYSEKRAGHAVSSFCCAEFGEEKGTRLTGNAGTMVLLSKVVTRLKILVIQPNAQCRGGNQHV